jgi:hypothetical protein
MARTTPKKAISLRVPVEMLDQLTEMADFYGLSVQDMIIFMVGTQLKQGQALEKGLHDLPNTMPGAIDMITEGIQKAIDRLGK